MINEQYSELIDLIKQIKVTVTSEHNIWDDIMIILMLEELSEKYDSRKQHILNSKDVTSDNMLQILFSEKVRIQANHMTELKSDVVMIIQE